MKPLVIITTFNRKKETIATLRSLEDATDLDGIELVVVDNGSTDGTADVVADFAGKYDPVIAYLKRENIGCPRALNLAIENHRKPRQPVVKFDNDVRILTSAWNVMLDELIERYEEKTGIPIAMVSAFYDGVLDGRVQSKEAFFTIPLYHISPIIGHAVWHTGAFMDEVGYFDVLSPDHLYGFEDKLLTHKAERLGWQMITWEAWEIQNIQRHNSLGDERNPHVEAMRPLYNSRRAALANGGSIYTGPDGQPMERKA